MLCKSLTVTWLLAWQHQLTCYLTQGQAGLFAWVPLLSKGVVCLLLFKAQSRQEHLISNLNAVGVLVFSLLDLGFDESPLYLNYEYHGKIKPCFCA